MTTMTVLATAAQMVAVFLGAPWVIGLMRQVRARLEGRVGAGVGQPWRDVRKLLRKQQVTPEGTTVIFPIAPAVVAGSALLIAGAIPLVTTASPLGPAADLFAVVGLLLIGTVALTLAALDTGTAFGGMGASRAVTVAALVEPTLLMAVFALSVPAQSTNLGAIVSTTEAAPWLALSPSALLSLAALVLVIMAEAGRLPVDNPSTHLELTMIHEAMVLEYAGPRLAVTELASAMRLTVLLALLANLFAPIGIAGPGAGAAAVLLALVVIIAKVALLAAAVAFVEVFLAKLRLFRVPELLAGSFVLGLLAVTAAYFFAGAGG